MPFWTLPDAVGVRVMIEPGGSSIEQAELIGPQLIPAGELVTLPPPLKETINRIQPAFAVAIFEKAEQPLLSHARTRWS